MISISDSLTCLTPIKNRIKTWEKMIDNHYTVLDNLMLTKWIKSLYIHNNMGQAVSLPIPITWSYLQMQLNP